MRTSGSDVDAGFGCLRRRVPSALIGWTLVATLSLCAAVLADEPSKPQPTRPAGEQPSGKVWGAAPPKPTDITPKAVTALRPKFAAVAEDGLGKLGSVKVLDVREGEALLRIDGQEKRLRPGDMLKTDRIESISPERIVLLRPAEVDERKGETLIIVDLLGPGRSRMRMYAERNWMARPLAAVE